MAKNWYDGPKIDALIARSKIPVARIGHWMTANDIRAFYPSSSQIQVSGNGPALGVAVSAPITIDALQVIVDTVEAASTLRVGVYASNADGYPVTLLGSVSVPGTAAGNITGVFGTPLVLPAGYYWLATRVSSLTSLRPRGCTPAQQYQIDTARIAGVTNEWLVADFGTSAALTPTISSWTFGAPDHVVLAGMRRSA
jgi:hypothetical protein